MTEKINNNLNRSLSDTDVDRVGLQRQDSILITPPSFAPRMKRRRESDSLNEITALREEMQNMCKTLLAAQEHEFKKNTVILQGIQQTSVSIESSISFLTAQNEELKKKVELLEGKIKQDNLYIITLEDRLEIMQLEGRKANFEIKNVPKKPNETTEDLLNMVFTLSRSVAFTILQSERGGYVLLMGQNTYRTHGKNMDRNVTWYCSKRRWTLCQASKDDKKPAIVEC
ncbi:unnamed protein product [Diatraea saccharalis]|uniref:Uncharacterized protein n=1 Tax=Diatraea saccharalis TaxID=40085 RepID=A0A9N9WEC2_9NEOP|nr:unnamed protein product [Diatraea saccharalis]